MESKGYYDAEYQQPERSEDWDPKEHRFGPYVLADDSTRYTYIPTTPDALARHLTHTLVDSTYWENGIEIVNDNPLRQHSKAYYLFDIDGTDGVITVWSWRTDPDPSAGYFDEPWDNIHAVHDPGTLRIFKGKPDAEGKRDGKTEVELITGGKQITIEIWEALSGERLEKLRRLVRQLH